MTKTVREKLDDVLELLNEKVHNKVLPLYNKCNREVVEGNLRVEKGGSCLDGRQHSFAIRYTDKVVDLDKSPLFNWVLTRQDFKNGCNDEFGYTIEITQYGQKFHNRSELSHLYMFNDEVLKIFSEVANEMGMEVFRNKLDERERKVLIFVPTVDEEIEKMQLDRAINFLVNFYNAVIEQSELNKRAYEENLFRTNNDFRARAEEIVNKLKSQQEETRKTLPNIELSVELYVDNDNKNSLYISDNGSSGCKYVINNLDEVAEHIKEYVKNCNEN